MLLRRRCFYVVGGHKPEKDCVHEHNEHPPPGERVHVGGGVDARQQLTGEMRTLSVVVVVVAVTVHIIYSTEYSPSSQDKLQYLRSRRQYRQYLP